MAAGVTAAGAIISALDIVAADGVTRDFFAVLVAVAAGIAVLFYAAASDLFELKFFKFDRQAMKLPREARVEYWYTRLARRFWDWVTFKPPRQTHVDYWYTKASRRFESFLASGGWSYAKAKKQARLRVKKDWRKLRSETRRMLPEAAKRLNRDIALGALAIAIVLVALLVLSLV